MQKQCNCVAKAVATTVHQHATTVHAAAYDTPGPNHQHSSRTQGDRSSHVPACLCSHATVLYLLQVSFVASSQAVLADGSRVVVMVDQYSRLVQTPVGPGGSLPLFDPFNGNSISPAAYSALHQAGPAASPAELQQDL